MVQRLPSENLKWRREANTFKRVNSSGSRIPIPVEHWGPNSRKRKNVKADAQRQNEQLLQNDLELQALVKIAKGFRWWKNAVTLLCPTLHPLTLPKCVKLCNFAQSLCRVVLLPQKVHPPKKKIETNTVAKNWK